MGKQFDVVYDDFTGGHYMGPTQANQPRNTWTGANVICTADQGFLMPDGGWTKPADPAYSPSSAPVITPPATFPPPLLSPSGAFNLDVVFGTSLGSTIYRQNPVGGSAGTLGTTAAGPLHSAVVTMLGNRLAFVNGAGGASAYLVTSSGTSTTVTTSANFSLGMWWWNNFGFGCGNLSNRLYFSAAGDPTSWPAANYVDIGESGRYIQAIVPTNEALYIGKSDGWWVLTGVPGQTATLRRLTRIGIVGPPGNGGSTPPTPVWAAAACETRQGILFRSERGPGLNLLRGTQVDQFAYMPYGEQVGYVVPAGEYVQVLTTGDTLTEQAHMFVWSDVNRRWRHKPMPTPASQGATSQGIRWAPALDGDVAADWLYAVSIEGYSGSSFGLYTWYANREPLEPQVDAFGYYDTATVTLSEYSQATPFAVKEMIVEVDFGQPATQGAQRSVKASVVTQSVTDLDQTFPIDTGDLAVPFSSSQFGKTWQNANTTRRGHRQTVRFAPTDGAAGTLTAAPVIEMTGVKVRRVILRCETV